MNRAENLQGLCVGITGAGGYVGSILAGSLRNAGAGVIEFSRNPNPHNSFGRPFSLADAPSRDLFKNVQVLIHGAYDFAAYGWEQIHRINVEGTQKLFAAAAQGGVKNFILISTISAFPGCRSQYGRAKLEIEKIAGEYNAIILRPGLVYGEHPGGMMGSLRKLASLPLVTPMLGMGGFVQYTAHEEDLAQLVCYLAAHADVPIAGPIVAANETGHTLREIMSILVTARGKRPVFFPIPANLVWLGLSMLEKIGLRPRMRSDSLISLLNQNPDPDFSPLRHTGISFRPFMLASNQE